MWVRVRSVVARETPRTPHPHPVRRAVDRAPEECRIHERLRDLQGMAIPRRPVRTQTPYAVRQRPRRQVHDPRRLRQHQKAGVVADQMQPTKLHRPVPAQPAVPRGALERPRLPAHQRQPVPAPHRNMAQAPTRKLPKAQVVVLAHQRIPAPPLARQRHSNLPPRPPGRPDCRTRTPRRPCNPSRAIKPAPCPITNPFRPLRLACNSPVH